MGRWTARFHAFPVSSGGYVTLEPKQHQDRLEEDHEDAEGWLPPSCWWLLASAVALAPAGAALAAEGEGRITYDPSTGSQYFESVAGVLYVLLVAWFLYRTISRRAKKFTSEVRPAALAGRGRFPLLAGK